MGHLLFDGHVAQVGAGIATGILSVSTPGVHLGDAALARDKAREVNEFAADVARRMPDRFGFFATLTLPDVEGAEQQLLSWNLHLAARAGLGRAVGLLPSDIVFTEPPPAS